MKNPAFKPWIGANPASPQKGTVRHHDHSTPKELDLHLIADNYATHKHKKVKAWLVRHPRFHVHFIPTSASWLNAVERFFAELTQKRLRRRVYDQEKAHFFFDKY